MIMPSLLMGFASHRMLRRCPHLSRTWLLTLTCKTLWIQVTLRSSDVLHKLKRCTPLDETMHFLRLLERDNSRFIRCTVCFRVHYRMRHESKRLANLGLYVAKRRRCSESWAAVHTPGPLGKRLSIYREGLELVLRAYELGPTFGLSLNTLQQWSRWEHLGLPVRGYSFAPTQRSW